MPGADLTGVLGVVIEVFLGQHAVLVSDEPVRRHFRRVELHLDLHVFRDGHQGAADLLHQDLAGLGQRVDVGVVAVGLVGQMLQHVVFIVPHAESQGGEGDVVFLGIPLDQVQELSLPGGAQVEVTVGGQDHPVDAAPEERSLRRAVRQAQTFSAVGAAAGGKPFQRLPDGGLVVA